MEHGNGGLYSARNFAILISVTCRLRTSSINLYPATSHIRTSPDSPRTHRLMSWLGFMTGCMDGYPGIQEGRVDARVFCRTRYTLQFILFCLRPVIEALLRYLYTGSILMPCCIRIPVFISTVCDISTRDRGFCGLNVVKTVANSTLGFTCRSTLKYATLRLNLEYDFELQNVYDLYIALPSIFLGIQKYDTDTMGTDSASHSSALQVSLLGSTA